MPRLARLTIAALLLAGTASTARADAPEIEALQRQVEALAKEVAALKAAQAQAPQAKAQAPQAMAQAPQAKAPAPTKVAVSLPAGKPTLASADGDFTANLRSIIMLDAGKFFQDPLPASVPGRDLNEGFNFRRARIGFDGRVFRDFEYSFVYEFGGTGGEDPGRIYEASVTYGALKPWRLRLGAFDPNVGLAAAASTSQIPLLERPAPAEIARNVAAGDSRAAVQVSGAGAFSGGPRWFAAGAFTGATLTSITSSGSATAAAFDEQTAWTGRLALATPAADKTFVAHLGANLQYVVQPTDAGAAATPRYAVQLRDRPELRLDATRLVDTGAIDADHLSVAGLEAGLGVGPFVLEAEAFRFAIDRRFGGAGLPDPKFSAWYVQGVWVLTGEARGYKAQEARFESPKIAKIFDPAAGTWGVVELAARYSLTDLDFRAGQPGRAAPAGGVRGGEQRIATVGLNWYLNPAIRLMVDYQHVDVDRLNATGAEIGQTYDAIAARTQFTF